MARPPLSLKRLRVLSDGRLALELKRAWDDGTTAILFRPMELLERLAALVPHPRHHLVVYHGVLASRHRWRSWVVPPRPEGEEGSGRKGRRCRWIPWSKLLLRTFGVESERCPQCGTWMVARAVVRARPTIRHLLGVLGRPWEPEQRVPRPARSLPEPYLDGW